MRKFVCQAQTSRIVKKSASMVQSFLRGHCQVELARETPWPRCRKSRAGARAIAWVHARMMSARNWSPCVLRLQTRDRARGELPRVRFGAEHTAGIAVGLD